MPGLMGDFSSVKKIWYMETRHPGSIPRGGKTRTRPLTPDMNTSQRLGQGPFRVGQGQLAYCLARW